MKKPNPPFSSQQRQTPVAQAPQVIQQTYESQTLPSPQAIDPFSLPIEPPSNFFDIINQETEDIYIDDVVIEARDSSVAVAATPDGFQKKCVNCANYWGLETLAPVKNTRDDGTPFTRREEYCIFSDKLFALSEREVFTCTRFTAKKKA
jgi:hypothetical protein